MNQLNTIKILLDHMKNLKKKLMQSSKRQKT